MDGPPHLQGDPWVQPSPVTGLPPGAHEPATCAEARHREVPLLLSVGYAACHWCHEVPRLAAVSGF